MIQGKRRKINYKIKHIMNVDPSEWFKVENTHEAIVPKEIFETVQRILFMDTRTSPDSENVSVLAGFVRCGECGQNMVRRSAEKNGKKYCYYHCLTYKSGKGCSSHLISETSLVRSVTKRLEETTTLLTRKKLNL